jgi:hypothetical protein
MKQFLPLALAALLAACVTPEDRTTVHQRQLEKEARENFMALKAREQTTSVRHVRLAENEPAPPARIYRGYSIAERPRRPDDTIYYWDMPRHTEPQSALYWA